MALAAVAVLTAQVAEAQSFFTAKAAPAATEQQLANGKARYGDKCATCHGADLRTGEFGPALTGPVFRTHWSPQSFEALQSYIQTRMPPSEPGALGSQGSTDVAAYILSLNASAGGPAPVEALRRAPPEDAMFKATQAARNAKLQAMAPVTDALLRSPPAADWLIWRRTYQALGYTPLAKINKANVDTLHPAWSWTLPISQNEITPLVHDGVMFIESGATVEALDAVSGDMLWQYVRPLPDILAGGRNWRAKTMAIYEDRLYLPTVEGHVVALDARTGKPVWDHEVVTAAQADRKGGAEGNAVQMTGGPIVAKGKVIIGVSLGLRNARGGDFIIALDARSGQEVWRFHTIARPGDPGGNSWNGAPLDERYGAGIWTAGSYDPDLNLVYFGTGNTYDTGTLLTPHPQKGDSNDGLYTDSTLALNADTGKLAWYFQHHNRDIWDLDWAFEQSLVTLPVKGAPRDLVVTGGKIALFDAVDRATGRYVFSRDAGLQNVIIGIDPVTGRKTSNPDLEPKPGRTALLCPSAFGARNWPATAFNPKTYILYVPLLETCGGYSWNARDAAEIAAGGDDRISSAMARPGEDGKFGRVQAINLATGKTLWTARQRAPMSSSILATGGGLVFSGSLDRWFKAYDETTGRVLWQTRLNASPSSSPISYSVAGEQYVAVVTGGGGPLESNARAWTPEFTSPGGATTVFVFKLPHGGKVGPRRPPPKAG